MPDVIENGRAEPKPRRRCRLRDNPVIKANAHAKHRVPAPLGAKREKQGNNISIVGRNLAFFLCPCWLARGQMRGDRRCIGIARLY